MCPDSAVKITLVTMINNLIRDFSGCPVVRTPHSHCLGPGSIPGQGTRIPQAMQLSQKQINSSKSHKKSRVWGRDSFKKKKKKQITFGRKESESHSVMSNSLWPHGLYSPRNSPGQDTEVGSRSLLQGIFPTQGSNPGLPHCRRIL